MYMGGKFIQTHPCKDAGELSIENVAKKERKYEILQCQWNVDKIITLSSISQPLSIGHYMCFFMTKEEEEM